MHDTNITTPRTPEQIIVFYLRPRRPFCTIPRGYFMARERIIPVLAKHLEKIKNPDKREHYQDRINDFIDGFPRSLDHLRQMIHQANQSSEVA